MSEQTTGWDALVELGEVADALPEAPQDVASFLLWADALAERIREARTLMEQDAAAEKLRHKRYCDRQQEKLDRVTRMEAELRRGCEAMRPVLLPGKAKSRVLPSGLVVAFRSRPVRLEVQDKAALEAWAKGRSEMWRTRTVVEADLPAIREHFKRTGEVPDGAEVVGGYEDFDVKWEG